MKWIKVYFTKDQYDEYRSGNGLAIGYTEGTVNFMKRMERANLMDFELSSDPLDHMTKVPPECISRISWAPIGRYVVKKRRERIKPISGKSFDFVIFDEYHHGIDLASGPDRTAYQVPRRLLESNSESISEQYDAFMKCNGLIEGAGAG